MVAPGTADVGDVPPSARSDLFTWARRLLNLPLGNRTGNMADNEAMPQLPLSSAIRARQPLTGRPEAARADQGPAGAPAEAIPCPADIILDALKLRSEANGASSLAPAFKMARLVNGAQEQDAYEAAYGASGVVDKLAPTLSRGIVGAGLNVLIVGTGAQQLTERHKAFVDGVDKTLRHEPWGFGAVYNLTSLLQQVAVFWRTMGNSTYKAGMWTLKHAARLPALAAPVGRVSQGIAMAAATPVGRALGFLNKWIPLLNAAWVMLAIKTAWDVGHDAKSSTTAKAVAVAGVAASVAAVWAGIALGGMAFMGVTFGSIVCDLLLVEVRYRDKTSGDADALAKRWLSHPGEGLAAAGRWGRRVGGVIAQRAKTVIARLKGEKVAPIVRPTRGDAGEMVIAPTPKAVDPRAKLKVK